MSKITEDQVKRAADLARLAITDEEAERYTQQINEVFSIADQLQGLNTDNIEPTTHIFSVKNVLRDDVPQEGLTHEQVFKNAKEHEQDGQFRVPAIME